MKIINKLTIRYLKENKKRTILTILCIALSVIMISCVGIAFYSGKQFYKDYIEKTVGDYHYVIIENSQSTVDLIKNDNQIEEYYISSTEEYYYRKQNYSFLLKNGEEKYFDKYNYQDALIKGKLPENPKEIILSQNYLNNLNNKKIGDQIILNNDYINNGEKIKKRNEFLIVGVYNEDKLNDSYHGKSYDAISYIDINNKDYYSIYVKDKDVSNHIFDHTQKLSEKINQTQKIGKAGIINYNNSYLAIQDIFEEDSQSFFLMVYSMIAGLLVIIVFISLFIIYQAFNLSANDRIQYLGMLSSVGATPKQKKRSVYFEGLILSLISIPLGTIISFIGLSITFFLLSQLDTIKNLGTSISATISLEYLAIVIVISLMTIFISLYLPARKISKISVIDALKKNDEIKVKSRKLRTGIISNKFFKINHQLALKNYKRQGKRSKVIVFSLVISMAAFVGIFSFGTNMFKEAEKTQNDRKFDIELTISDNQKQMTELHQLLDKNDKVENYYYTTEIRLQAKLEQSYINKTPFYDNEIRFVGVSNDLYKKICNENNIDVKENQAIFINDTYLEKKKAKRRFKKMDHQFIKALSYKELDENNNEKTKKLPLFDSIEMINEDKYRIMINESGIIVPLNYILDIETSASKAMQYYIMSPSHVKLAEELEDANFSVYNYAASVEQTRQMFIVVQTFIYGFVLIMILFTLMNIVNMMSASIDKRKKEFAMMLSVGMSPKGIQKMILSESLIYGLKTLLYGIPLSLLVEFWIYIQTYGQNNDAVVFEISYIAYLIAFIMVMIVMVITFRVGLRQLKKQNIIETLKDDM